MSGEKGNNESREQIKDLLAGTMAGLFSKVIEYPFDTLKVRLQTTPEKYGNSALQCFRTMTESEGYMSIFRGLPAPLFGAMAENSIIFWSYGLAGRYIGGGKPKSELSLTQIGASAFVAGFAVGTWLTPVEYVKCRLQARHTAGMYNSAFHCLQLTLASPGGVRTLFTGFGTTQAREMPGNAVYFMAYETVSKWLTPANGQPAPVYAVLAGGGSAGVAYWSCIYPFDMVKSRIQTSATVEPFATVFVREYRTKGIAGLYRGIGVTLPRAILSDGVIFFAYEYSKRLLDSLF